MKKGYNVLIISFAAVIILAITATSVYGDWCIEGDAGPGVPCVCGHLPDSLLGYGQVKIGEIYYSCDNDPSDGICPEDFKDPLSGIIGNCINYPDADCDVVNNITSEGNVQGYITNQNGEPLAGARVTFSTLYYGNGTHLATILTTDFNGLYNSTNVTTGSNAVKVQMDGYDTAISEVIVFGGKAMEMNFTLINGTCHGDCTNSYGRCNSGCNNMTFLDGGECNCKNSTLVTANETLNACNNVIAGKTVWIKNHNETHSWYVTCCEGEPHLQYNAKADISGNDKIKNLVKTEKIVRYGYNPSRLVIAYWR
jgi:hypothetical protein